MNSINTLLLNKEMNRKMSSVNTYITIIYLSTQEKIFPLSNESFVFAQ